MEWQYFSGDCSDPAVQDQAKQNFIVGFNEVFAPGDPDYCQREKICELDNIQITCGTVQGRKRRNAQVSISRLNETFGNAPREWGIRIFLGGYVPPRTPNWDPVL